MGARRVARFVSGHDFSRVPMSLQLTQGDQKQKVVEGDGL